MYKVKSFREEGVDELEESINTFLSAVANEVEYVDLKYAIAHEAVSTDSETGVYHTMRYTAVFVYKEKEKTDFAFG